MVEYWILVTTRLLEQHKLTLLSLLSFLFYRQIQTKAELKIFNLRYLNLLTLRVFFFMFILTDCGVVVLQVL